MRQLESKLKKEREFCRGILANFEDETVQNMEETRYRMHLYWCAIFGCIPPRISLHLVCDVKHSVLKVYKLMEGHTGLGPPSMKCAPDRSQPPK